jgi:hypothetical protein
MRARSPVPFYKKTFKMLGTISRAFLQISRALLQKLRTCPNLQNLFGFPQRLKPNFPCQRSGTAEAVPFQN